MLGMPELGASVKVWPMPGRRVLAAAYAPDAPMLAQAMHLESTGRTVVWDFHWISMLKEGAILLHPPPCEEHDHGPTGVSDCGRCGRTLRDAQVYDVHRAHGIAERANDVACDQVEAESARIAAEKSAAAAVKNAKDEAADHVARARQALPKAFARKPLTAKIEEPNAAPTPPTAAAPDKK